MEEQPKKLLQWHVAFYAEIQIEFEKEAEYLFYKMNIRPSKRNKIQRGEIYV